MPGKKVNNILYLFTEHNLTISREPCLWQNNFVYQNHDKCGTNLNILSVEMLFPFIILFYLRTYVDTSVVKRGILFFMYLYVY